MHRPFPALTRSFTCVLLFGALLSGCLSDGPSRSSEATLVWSDEFDGTALDTTKWGHRSLGPRRKAVNVRDAVSLDGDGHLVITVRRAGDAVHTGMIGTQEHFMRAFGYWEARMRFQDEEGSWSAFWIQSPTMGQVGDPETAGTEIDVIEYLAVKGDTVLNNLHWNGYGEHHQHAGHATAYPGLSEGFHTAGVEWTPEEYVFYVDSTEVWRTRRAVSHRPQYAILSMEVDDWGGDVARAHLPDTLLVDYVRVYDRRPW